MIIEKEKHPIIFKMVRFANGVKNNKSYFDGYYKPGKYLDYILRKNAVYENNLEDKSNLLNVNTNEYYSFDELEKLYDDFSDLNKKQFVWDCVISFEQMFAKENLLNEPKVINELIKDSLEVFFERNHLKMDDLEIWSAFHINTDNPHIHIGWFEKHEKYLNKNGEKVFHSVGALGGNGKVDKMKLFCADVLKQSESKYFQTMCGIRKNLTKNLNIAIKSEPIKDAIDNLRIHWVKNNIKYFQFERLKDEEKTLVMNTVNILLKQPEFKDGLQKYKKSIENVKEARNHLLKMYGLKNNLQVKKLDEWFSKEKDRIYIQTANVVLKEIKKDINGNLNRKASFVYLNNKVNKNKSYLIKPEINPKNYHFNNNQTKKINHLIFEGIKEANKESYLAEKYVNQILKDLEKGEII